MKTLIYQIFMRLYGNVNPTRKYDGTIEENGCGKMADINDAALEQIARSGYTHVWFTGIIRHASTTHYPFFKTRHNANVVKGRAGSPYAIADYYDIDPDLAVDPENRMQEFKELLQRAHKHGLKVVIDFVPNHVARQYSSEANPEARALGDGDNPNAAFDPGNNFYYLPGQEFRQPVSDRDAEVYRESPAKVSGNDAFTPAPSVTDWYETVKLNYGWDFEGGRLVTNPRPDTWGKMRDILHYWVRMGVDAFRVDMAEMVPVEFWRWVIPQIVATHPSVIFIAETYDLNKYRDYIAAGFNYLYDKENFYDTVRAVACGTTPATEISNIWRRTEGIGKNMLYFLENHDEQRIASDFFLGDGSKAKAAMLLATLMGNGATMVYFAQELGERGMDKEGFSGHDGRTTIFDYWSLPLQAAYAGQKHDYDCQGLPQEANALRVWYKILLSSLTQKYDAFATGNFYDLMWVNQGIFLNAQKIYAFLRYDEKDRFIVIVNFSPDNIHTYIKIPADAWRFMGSTWNESIQPVDMLGNAMPMLHTSVDKIKERGLEVSVPANDGLVLKF